MAKAAGTAFNALKSGIGAVGRGIGSVASKALNFLGGSNSISGLSGSTGQPLPGLPGATSSALSQAIPNIANFAGGGGAPSVAASAFGAGPIGDVGGGSMSDMLKSLGVGGSSPGSGFGADIVKDDLISSTNPSIAESLAPALSTAAAAPGGSSGRGGDIMSRLFGNGNPKDGGGLLQTLLPAVGIGYSAWRSNQPVEGIETLRDVANEARGQSQMMTRSANEAMQGNLPGGAQQSIDAALRSAEATVRSRYAGLGLTGSTMEAQDLADLQRRAVAQRFEIGRGLAQTGLSAAAGQGQLAGSLYEKILDAETQQGTAFGDALAEFAGLLTE